MSDKPILSLAQRRQLEKSIADLAQTQSEFELTTAARQIVHTYPSEQVLTTLIKHLDTNLSQLRGGLAHVATLLPPEEAVPALRSYTANRNNPAHGRFTAAQILDRYLHAPAPAGMLADLQGNDDAAFQSLVEAVEESKRNRHVLLEYVTQMQEHGEEIAFLVLNSLGRLPGEDRVELLRLIAQDERKGVAQAALRQLEQLTTPGELTAATRALHILRYALPTPKIEGLDRTLRKLQMRGKGYQAPSTAGWRALISPAEPNGSQSIWLLRAPQSSETQGTLISAVANLRFGVAGYYASEDVDGAQLPSEQPIGQLIRMQTESGPAVFLEAPFAFGLWLVQTALRLHAEEKARFPISGEYRLYNDLVWQFAPAHLTAELQPFFAVVESGTQPVFTAEQLLTDVEALQGHPIMANWLLAMPRLKADAAKDEPVLASKSTSYLVKLLLQEIDQTPERDQLLAAFETGLRAQAAWLQMAGDPNLAQSAWRLAQMMQKLPARDNPLLAWMLERGMAG